MHPISETIAAAVIGIAVFAFCIGVGVTLMFVH